MAEYGLATISDLPPHRRLRPRAADPPRPRNTPRPSPISAAHIGKRLAGKLHEPFERAGGGRAISPTSPDSTARKPMNKAGRPAAELAEPRPGTKGNADQQSTHRTQSRARVTRALERVRKATRQRKREQFTSLLHHMTVDLFRTAFYALKRKAAPGVDGMMWADYEADLEPRLEDLHGRVHRGAYRPDT